MIRKDQQATMHKKGNKIQKALQISNGPPRRSHTVKGETADCIRSSLTLPKLYLATYNNGIPDELHTFFPNQFS